MSANLNAFQPSICKLRERNGEMARRRYIYMEQKVLDNGIYERPSFAGSKQKGIAEMLKRLEGYLEIRGP